MEALIKVQGVTLDLGADTVLKNIQLEFEKGKIYGLVGKNGSGKTVLMKCICGFMRPQNGSIVVDGKTVGKDMDFPENLGIIIETPGFLAHFSGYQNLKMLAALNNKITKNEIFQAMELVGLNPRLKKTVSKYSLGMRQRLGIAQAIMENPNILLLDEPMNSLDREVVLEMRELFLKLKEQGKTIIISSHSTEDIDTLCDQVFMMQLGQIVGTEKPNEEDLSGRS